MLKVFFILGLVAVAGCSHFDSFSWQDYPEAYEGFPEEYARVRYPELNDGDPVMVRNNYESDAPPKSEQSSMMETYETFKRQAERVSVPGDEYNRLAGYATTESGPTQALSWQTATVMSILCVGAGVIGVILGVVYWPKKSFGDPTDEGMQITKFGKLEASQADRSRPSSGDQSLAKSAQMYHYQQQKQQMLAMEQASGRTHTFESEPESGSEVEEPDVNVYECPGLATAGEFDVANPLFHEEETNKDGPSTSTQNN
uniref:Neural proliferation differentiation and control protein 1 n=2 Tax=Schistocephalus solidus TaxID=70667 RepID=A0A0X3PDR6_SCHSO